jgi:hypothetical protein
VTLRKKFRKERPPRSKHSISEHRNETQALYRLVQGKPQVQTAGLPSLGECDKIASIRARMSFDPTTIDGMMDSYAEYLRPRHRANSHRFELPGASSREAAVAEAIVFGLLQSLHLRPEIHDDVEKGGPDFICAGSTLSFGLRRVIKPSPEDQFVVEATSLDPDAVTNRSTLPNALPEDVSGGSFSLVTKSICNKAKDKTTQLGGYPMPRVLAVASSHAFISTLFNTGAAEFALTSEPRIVFEVGSSGPGSQCTDMHSSVFLRIDPVTRAFVPCRQTTSAILLVAVYGNHSEVYGILHPEPARPLNVGFFPKVPFVRLSKWPVTDGVISTEWVIADPDGLGAPHWPVTVDD